MGIALARLSMSSRRVVCAAAAKARSTAASSPCAQSKARLSGASGWMVGPPMAVATWTGRSSRSKAIISAASRPASRVSATTTASASPAKRTAAPASAGRRGLAPREPSRFFTTEAAMEFSSLPAKSCAVKTATTPGAPAASLTSIESTRACATGLRRKTAWSAPSGAASSM